MPRKKRKYTRRSSSHKPEIVEHPTPRQGITKYTRSHRTFSFRWAESYVSLLMGVIIIIVVVLSVVTLIRATHHMQQDTSSIATGPTPTTVPTSEPKQNKNVYVVESGDDLWHIAEKEYGDGYKWIEIAKANNLSNPGMIFSGNLLVLPKISEVAQTQVAATPSQLGQTTSQQEVQTIKGDRYTVVTGDNLWNIAVRAYADGYRWIDIAEANDLSNPNLIHSGNVLIIPR